jgi:hypothetical protein
MPSVAVAALMVAGLFVGAIGAEAQTNSSEAKPEAQKLDAKRDGRHDFDFDIGTWKTHLSRRLHPLTGSTAWIELDGTTVVRKVWNGRANLAELEADGPGGHLEALSLRLYNPPIQPVEPQFCQQQRWYPEPAHDRRIQKWARRIFRSGAV